MILIIRLEILEHLVQRFRMVFFQERILMIRFLRFKLEKGMGQLRTNRLRNLFRKINLLLSLMTKITMLCIRYNKMTNVYSKICRRVLINGQILTRKDQTLDSNRKIMFNIKIILHRSKQQITSINLPNHYLLQTLQQLKIPISNYSLKKKPRHLDKLSKNNSNFLQLLRNQHKSNNSIKVIHHIRKVKLKPVLKE